MAERKNVAINFLTDYNLGTGLALYLLNIIRTLNSLDDSLKPSVTIIHIESAPLDDIKALNYPYINFYLFKNIYVKPGFLKRSFNSITKLLFNKPFFIGHDKLASAFPQNIDLIYPYISNREAEYIKEKVYWKADFQDKYYPEFIPQSERDWYDKFLNEVGSKKDNVLVLSSYDALNDYKKFYPNYQNEIKLLRFASFLPDFSDVKIDDVLLKYQVNTPYFFLANQFWPHKNHITVFKAINAIKDKLNCVILISGKTTSYRDPDYFPSLMKYIEDNDLSRFIKILGFIDRKEQLQLMNNAIAIIQPSLFEGWSTVIEDAKALSKLVIASNLPVNIEQAKVNAAFFESLNYEELGELILKTQSGEIKSEVFDYNTILDSFKQDIVNILNY